MTTPLRSTDLTPREWAAVDRLVDAVNAAQARMARFTTVQRQALIVALTRVDNDLTPRERTRLVRYWTAR